MCSSIPQGLVGLCTDEAGRAGRHMNAKGTNPARPGWLVLPLNATTANSVRNTHCGSGKSKWKGFLDIE